MEIGWTFSLAYVVGLIATDGNLSKDGRHLEFTSKDIEQLETFKRCLGLKNRIAWKTSGYSSKRYPHIQFGNVKLYRWLVRVGVTPKKSKTLGALEIPDEFFFDFLRGSLDGDGCIRTYMDAVFPNSRRLYSTFYSGSRPHLEWIRQTVLRLLGVAGRICPGMRVWRLTYAKKTSRIVLKAIYYQKGVPCLERKRRLAELFLRENAEMAELADARASGARGGNPIGVQIPVSALFSNNP